ncbi:type VI secretion system protein TssL, long form [Burkholderia glumae]|uniref:type VI secretion system protein TssL, long form n=1 Tax=Burkholderia glumae TaxID=337 RepID=UPI0021505517|nr:type VI secretion system protein TssL, long form [Burkholderia glumae]
MSTHAHDEAFSFLAEPGQGETVSGAGASGGAFGPPPAAMDSVAFEPPEDAATRLARVQAARNPLLEAARSLLRMLGDMPASLESSAAVESLRALLVREVAAFQKVCDKANLPWKHVAAVRYALCTGLDEAANRTQWGGGGIWAARSLLIRFEGEVDGGEKFFLLIGRMATDPQEYVDVLEVMYRILGLGFEGRYSVAEDGSRHLEEIRQRLLTLVSGARDTMRLEFSPHWRGEAYDQLKLLRSVPVWATASVAALVVFGRFGWYTYHLLTVRNPLEARILAIGRSPAPAAHAAPAHLPLRLSVLLKDEIARGELTVDEDARHSRVVFRGDTMFVTGKSRVRPELEPVLAKVAREVARVGGRVIVTGYTDSQPIHTREFPDNLVLSQKRAAFVADVLKAHGTPSERIVSIGKGDAQPVADNATPQGRSRNRRVEVLVVQ